MVCNDVDHHPDALSVGRSNEVLKVLSGPEVAVGFVPVTGPVAVVAAVGVVDGWGDPDGIKAHPGDIVQMVLHAFESTTAVVRQTSASTGATVSPCESVGKDLVN